MWPPTGRSKTGELTKAFNHLVLQPYRCTEQWVLYYAPVFYWRDNSHRIWCLVRLNRMDRWTLPAIIHTIKVARARRLTSRLEEPNTCRLRHHLLRCTIRQRKDKQVSGETRKTVLLRSSASTIHLLSCQVPHPSSCWNLCNKCQETKSGARIQET